jgi:hypothetical protein
VFLLFTSYVLELPEKKNAMFSRLSLFVVLLFSVAVGVRGSASTRFWPLSVACYASESSKVGSLRCLWNDASSLKLKPSTA